MSDLEVNALVEVNDVPLRFVGYGPIYQVECGIFKNDRLDSFTIMKKELAKGTSITGSTDLVMLKMPDFCGNPQNVGSAVSYVFGISQGDYSFVSVLTEYEKYYTASSCSERMGFRYD